jgi:hypothetical protein
MGVSPLVIEHMADVESSRLNSSSPKLNGVMTGRTFLMQKINLICKKLQTYL